MKRKAFSILLVIVFFFNIVPASFLNSPKIANAEEQIWQVPVNISNTSQATYNPSIVVDRNDNTHVVWEEKWFDSTIWKYRCDIYYAKHDSNSWSSPIKITHTPMVSAAGIASFPQIVVDSTGKVHVAWYETVDNPGGGWQSFVDYASFNNPEGAQPSRVFFGNFGYARNLALLADSKDKIHLLWVQDISMPTELVHAINEQGSWSTLDLARSNSWWIYGIDAAIDSNDNIHLAWVDGDGFYTNQWQNIAYSRYDGSSWSTSPIAPVVIENGKDIKKSAEVSIAVDSNNKPNVVWSRYGGNLSSELKFSKLTESSWTTPSAVFSLSSRNETNPDIVFSSGKLHLALVFYPWNSDSTLDKLLYSSYDGASWSNLTSISAGSLRGASRPSITCNSNGQLQCVCSGLEPDGNHYDIYHFGSQGNPTAQPPTITISSISNEQDPQVTGFAESNISSIKSIDYQIDGTDPNGWLPLSPMDIDGFFGSYRCLEFSFSLSGLSSGNHAIYMRTYDTNNIESIVVSYNFYVSPYIRITEVKPFEPGEQVAFIVQSIDFKLVPSILKIIGSAMSDKELSLEEKHELEATMFVDPIKMYARWETNAKIKTDSIKIYVDGKDLTSYAVIDGSEIFLRHSYYLDSLHLVRLHVETTDGLVAEREWNFYVSTDFVGGAMKGISKSIVSAIAKKISSIWDLMEAIIEPTPVH